MRLDRDEALGRDDALDERKERPGQRHAGRRPLEQDGQELEIEMVEMLVRDEQPVEPLGLSASGGGGIRRCSCGLTHGSTTSRPRRSDRNPAWPSQVGRRPRSP